MEQQNYGAIVSQKITEFRKQSGLTQEALAGKLGLSFQAVSKWENGLSCPDIALLPELADIFGIPVDGLFGRGSAEPKKNEQEETFSFLPWEDDGTLRAAAFIGRRLVSKADKDVEKIKVIYEGDALDVVSYLNLEIDGNVEGNVSVGNNLSCGGISSGASAGNNLSCGGISGGASAGNNLACGGISGGASAGNEIKCGGVSGGVSAGGDVTVQGDVDGDIDAKGSVTIEGRHMHGLLKSGRREAGPEHRSGESFSFLPWEDDSTLRAAVFVGRRLISKADRDAEKIKIVYEGDALDVISYLNLTVEGDVDGNVEAGGSISVGGDVSGDINAGGASVEGDAGGEVNAGGTVNIGGDAGDTVNAGGSVNIGGDVDGEVNAGGDANVGGDVDGEVNAGGNATVGGDAGGDVTAEGGDVTVGGDVSGDVQAEGDVKVEGNIEGGVTIRK